MPDLARNGQQIWITRGHLAAMAVATAAIAVLAFLVGVEVGRGDAEGAPPQDSPALAAFLPDASDEEALEALLREVERVQAEAEPAPTVGFNRELSEVEATVPPEAAPPSAVVTEVAAQPDQAPPPPEQVSGGAVPTDGWAVQIASYASQAEADAHVTRLAEAGLPAYRVAAVVTGETWHRVRVGGFRTKEAAAEARVQLSETLGLSDLMVATAP